MLALQRDVRLLQPLPFEVPPALEASAPPEARGLARDEVRLLVSYAEDDRMAHVRFRDLPCFLSAGDVLVVNTSGTMPAALPARRADGEPLMLHLSTRLPAELWLVELRRPANGATVPFQEDVAGQTLSLPGGAMANVHRAYGGYQRLWIASLSLPGPLLDYLAQHGRPIRYRYVPQDWPLEYYQTVYATEPGSVEMPSAGRAFSPELITQLVARGIQIAPLLLHTGVASLEDHEPPYEEYYRVPAATARLINAARAAGSRIIAVGTTAVRALETVADDAGRVHPGEGWTTLVIGPGRGLRAVDALLTGFHEPHATHLAMLEALAGRRHLEAAYAEALREGYLWHEFGDLHLIIGRSKLPDFEFRGS
jgi:S-adenosylmethionine:tRNA ribosyltransferase-isomerase